MTPISLSLYNKAHFLPGISSNLIVVNLPFHIPKSLASYAEQFNEDPEKAASRLKLQLKKRGPDAVGHFLLSWFYHIMDRNEDALEYALKAKIYAPGSPFLDKLHYYLAHPNRFDAWKPQTPSYPYDAPAPEDVSRPEPVLEDLDALIEKLSKVESQRIKVSPELPGAPSPAKVDVDDNVDDIASETLAAIHETQGKTEAAIQTYKRLRKLNEEKKDFYKQQITRLKKLRDHPGNQDREED